jgi:hypothetical protein
VFVDLSLDANLTWHMLDTDSLIGQTISHYRIIEKLVAAVWVLGTRLRTPNSIASLP